MLFRKQKSVLVASIVLCLAFVTTVATASVRTGWHGLSQTQRNRLILARAQEDNNRYTGVQCKEWVQNVVYNASDGEVYPPRNRNDYTWYDHPYVYRYPRPYPLNGVEPGQIIQMRWRNPNGTITPHTAIVVSRNSSGMTWIDCNWTNRDRTVRTHDVSYDLFNRRVGYYYNVYEIR